MSGSAQLPARFEDVEALEDFMTAPSPALVEDLAALDGDLIVLGVGAIGLAAMQYRARRWAAFASGANGIVVALAVLGWLFYTLTSVLSCLMYFTVPLSALSALLSLLAIGPILKTAAARQRLADAGLSLGL